MQPQAQGPDYNKFNSPSLLRPRDMRRNPQGPAKSSDQSWEAIKKAATEPNTGREFVTLLGAMYQAKRRNPAVQMTVPKMVTALQDGPLKQQMTQLFNLAKDEDDAHLAQRSQELQQARMSAASQPGTKPTPGQQPVGQAKPAAVAQGQNGQQGGALLQQLMKAINDTAPKLSTRDIKQASAALNQRINPQRKKNQRTKVPASMAVPQNGPMTATA